MLENDLVGLWETIDFRLIEVFGEHFFFFSIFECQNKNVLNMESKIR